MHTKERLSTNGQKIKFEEDNEDNALPPHGVGQFFAPIVLKSINKVGFIFILPLPKKITSVNNRIWQTPSNSFTLPLLPSTIFHPKNLLPGKVQGSRVLTCPFSRWDSLLLQSRILGTTLTSPCLCLRSMPMPWACHSNPTWVISITVRTANFNPFKPSETFQFLLVIHCQNSNTRQGIQFLIGPTGSIRRIPLLHQTWSETCQILQFNM